MSQYLCMSLLIRCLLLISLVVSFNVKADAIKIDMFVGEVKVLGLFDIDRVAIGNGSIIRVEALPTKEFLIIAEAQGSTSLKLWLNDGSMLDYNFRVSENDPQTRVRLEKMVKINVKIVEIRKNAVKELGINWSTSANGPAFATAGDFISSNFLTNRGNSGITDPLPLNIEPFSSYLGIASSVTSQINFLASSGDAMTLAEPTLSCRNGGSAQFLAGGEIPYPVTGINGQVSVEFREYGIKLDINPLVDDEGNIFTSILTEVSQIDPAVTVLGAPGILTRRTETQMNIKQGNTVVISGLLNTESSNDIDKVPLLGDIPLIGNLFKSRSYRNQASELVVFVTPDIVDPESAGLSERDQAILDYSTSRRDKVHKKVKFNLMD